MPGVLDAKTRQDIADQKAELIKVLQAQVDADHTAEITPGSGGSEISLFQERLWVIHQLEPDSTAYNLAVAWPGFAEVDADQTVAAIKRLASRHNILRAGYRERAGKPCMHVFAEPFVQIVNLPDYADEAILERVEQDRYAATHRPFDLENEPAVLWTVYRLTNGRVAVLISAHHIAMDQASFVILHDALSAECKVSSPAGALAPGLQYSDYAAWQRRSQTSYGKANDLEWWERRLAGAPQFSTFTPDHQGEKPAGESLSFSWDAELTRQIGQLARGQGATVYMTLLAACAAVLRAHTGQADAVLGSPMGLRERPEFERLIGPFVNLLLLPIHLDDDPTFAELVARARDAVLDAHEHRQASFEDIVGRLNPVRMFDRSPLFQLSVVMHDGAGGSGGGDISSGGAIQDLSWYAAEAEGQLHSSLEYRTDLYRPETMVRLCEHLETVMRAAVQNPHQKISQIPLLKPKEHEQVVRQFNATDLSVDLSPTIQQFERRVAATPEAIAASFEGVTLTYNALNRRANAIARHLQALGVDRGALVGVGMERSLDMLAALLAVQKTGGAYLPLDPGFPEDRLHFMLGDSGAGYLLTEGGLSLEPPSGVQVVDLATLDLSAVSDANLDVIISSSDIAYILYTSGSTGRPNGVVIEQAALSNFLGSMRIEPGLTSANVLAAVTTISFDIAGLELYLPLIVGAQIELISSETASDGAELMQQLEQSRADVLQATPATWRLLIEAGWRGGPNFRALCGGEALGRDLADAILERAGGLWNLYGPTETTIWSTVEKVERDAGQITVGHPIANTQVYVLNRNGQPCPIGVVGEVWIGGAGVARGYHQRELLNAERFAPDRFSDREGARLYKTGDIGHWRDDGRLVHGGRLDHQVKVRGRRIELGEIEAALRSHPAVRQAVVVARETGDADVRLVAYMVYADEELTGSEARAHLRLTLPDYMLPSLYVALDSIPLTPNGKIDRLALPDPYKRSTSANVRTPPTTAMERAIARIWQDLLKVESVSVEDNFFELGGHSLLSLRAMSAIQKETGWRAPPRALFFQTLKQIAASAQQDGMRVESA